MKKIFLTIAMVLSALHIQGQITETTSGDVGIGTTIPYEKLHIESDSDSKIKLKSTSPNSGVGISFQGLRELTGTSSHYIGTEETGHYNLRINADEKLKFQTNGTDRMTILGNGFVGIGTDSPVTKLDITNGTYQTYFTGNALTFKNSNVTSYIDKKDAGSLRFRMGVNYNTVMTIDSNLRVGIGTVTPDEKLDVNGNIRSTGTLSLGAVASSTALRDVISLYGNRLGAANMYGFGVEGDGTLYNKAVNNHRWYLNTNADLGSSAKMELNDNELLVNGDLTINNGLGMFYSSETGKTTRRLTINTNDADNTFIYNYDSQNRDYHSINIGGIKELDSGITIFGNGNVGIGITDPRVHTI